MEKVKSRFDYKWVVMAVCILMIFTSLGFCSSTKSLFLRSITVALDIPRSLFSLSDSIRYVTTTVVNLFFGALVMKFGAKKLVGCGFLSLIAFCLTYAFAENIYGFYLGGFFLGVGLSWCTTTMVGYVVGKWFQEKRGTVMLAANGLGAAVATQIVSPLIHDASVEGGFGYRNAYLLVAAILAAVLVLILIFFKEAPKGAVLTEEVPSRHKKKPARGRTWDGMDFSQSIRKAWFAPVALCVFLTGTCLQAVNNVATAHLEDVGMNLDFIATVVSLHAVALTVAKILAGISFDKFGLRITLLLGHVIAAGSIFCLALVQSDSYALASVYEIMISFALPLETIMLPLIATDLFGEKSYAKMMGLLVSINTAGYAIGSLLPNWVCDITGTYRGILFILAGCMVAVLVAFQVILTISDRNRKRIMEQA